jgi:hypothetical protein
MWSPEPTLKNGMFITNIVQPKNHEKIIFFIFSIRIIYS